MPTATRTDYITKTRRYASRVITATGAITATDDLVIANNGATNITVNAPDTLGDGFRFVIIRDASSTGTITLQGTGTTWQARTVAGLFGATTSLGTALATNKCTFQLVGTKWYRVTV